MRRKTACTKNHQTGSSYCGSGTTVEFVHKYTNLHHVRGAYENERHTLNIEEETPQLQKIAKGDDSVVVWPRESSLSASKEIGISFA